jgi:molybdopterin/thiamine biosynthesis adenylyltransferase/molybdopterin synthase catalytic subunit/rhodanese-related sulfurtransferase
LFRLTNDSLELGGGNWGAELRAEGDSSPGALVTFEGRVRSENQGKAVLCLEYEAAEDLARKEGERILEEAMLTFKLSFIDAVHRLGKLELGDVAVRVCAAAPHRRAAFAACEYVIDQVKQRVPIWKREHYADGSTEWLNTVASTGDASAYYSRQVSLPEVGVEGQAKLGRAKVLVVGAGGLGCPALCYLAGAGVGTIGIAEHDVVVLENLHRQVIYLAADVGKKKGACARKHLIRLNPQISVQWHDLRVMADNVHELFAGYDIVLDCTDNFATKFLLNEAAVTFGKRLIAGSIYQYEGQILVYDPQQGSPCLRCLWPQKVAAGAVGNCSEAGVLGAVPGIFGALQAAEALKLVLDIGEPLSHHLLLYDVLSGSFVRLRRDKDPLCPVCGSGTEAPDPEVDWEDLDGMENYHLVDIREAEELRRIPFADGIHIPMREVHKEHPRLPKEGTIVLVCAHGVRSLALANHLRERDPRFVSLRGGLAAQPARP